jgi:ubiquinone/menaquinone biosynthesis C-methylase UbiE
MIKQDDSSEIKWTEFYRCGFQEGHSMLWPSETLVQIMRGKYLPELDKTFRGKQVLDIGFGSGNNLYFLASLGLTLTGTEVTEDICLQVGEHLQQLGLEADLRAGTNRKIPFSDKEMDFLISWNVLHYEDCANKISEALREYARVLKKGGRFFISTTGPLHRILKGARALGNHRYLIGRDDDFRKGQVFFYFDTPTCIEDMFSELFSNVKIARSTQDLFGDVHDYFIISGVRR